MQKQSTPIKTKGGKRPGAGRPKGVPNKINGDLKAMIIGALDSAGGEKYLVKQAKEKPVAFLALLGRVLPMTLQGPGPDGEHSITFRWEPPQ